MAGSPNVFAALVDSLKRSMVSRIIAVIVLVIVGGAAAGGKYVMAKFTSHAPPAPVAQSVQRAPAHPAAAPIAQGPATQAGASPASPSPAAAGPQANAAAQLPAATAPAAGAPAQLASSEGAGAPVVTAIPQPSQQPGSSLAHLDEHLTYQYNALGRRDPFQSLVDGPFVGADVGGDAPPDPGGIKVVGIVWGPNDQFALVEDNRGNSFVLRKGDKVQNGYVEGLKRDGVVVNITAEGQSQSVVIPLVRKGDSNAR